MTMVCIAAFAVPLAVAGAILAPSPATAAGDTVLPGHYRVTTTIAGQAKPTIRHECFTAQDVAAMFRLPPDEGKCTASRSIVGGGRIDIARTCTGPRGATAGSIAGTYTSTGFAWRMQSRGPALPVPLDIRAVGQRVAATCPAD